MNTPIAYIRSTTKKRVRHEWNKMVEVGQFLHCSAWRDCSVNDKQLGQQRQPAVCLHYRIIWGASDPWGLGHEIGTKLFLTDGDAQLSKYPKKIRCFHDNCCSAVYLEIYILGVVEGSVRGKNIRCTMRALHPHPFHKDKDASYGSGASIFFRASPYLLMSIILHPLKTLTGANPTRIPCNSVEIAMA